MNRQTFAALQAAQSALNQIPRTKLTGPHRTSYEVASLIDAAIEAEAKAGEPAAPNGTYSLCEAVADLSAMFAAAPLLPQDSRESCSLCIDWAQGFELANAGHVWGETDARDYIDELEKWFVAKYAAWIAGPSDTRRNLLVTSTK